MPLFTIKTLPLNKAVDVPQILKGLGNKLSDVLNLNLNRVVIKWEYIPANHFLFNGKVTKVQERNTHHPFVEVSAVKKLSGDMRKSMVETIVENLSDELDIQPDNICIIINTLAQGELFVSGNFVGTSVKD